MSAEPSANAGLSSKAAFIFAAMAGISLAVGLVVYFGLAEVGDALLTAGWQGLFAISCAYVASLLACAIAWQLLLIDKGSTLRGSLFLWARWVRDGVGNLLAVVPGAGEMAGARELSQNGIRRSVAAATTVVDMTTEMLSQLVYTLMGLVLLFLSHPGEQSAWWAAAGLAVATVAVLGFLFAQRNGFILFLETLPARLGLTQSIEGLSDSDSVHAAIQAIYRHDRRVVTSVAIHLLGWLGGAAEAWIALTFMGHPLAAADVLSLESLVFALRTAAFIVPWAAGVQEGGYVVVGALFGLGPDVALALSLLKRAREIATGIPALIAWHWVEGKRLWRRGRLANSGSCGKNAW